MLSSQKTRPEPAKGIFLNTQSLCIEFFCLFLLQPLFTITVIALPSLIALSKWISLCWLLLLRINFLHKHVLLVSTLKQQAILSTMVELFINFLSTFINLFINLLSTFINFFINVLSTLSFFINSLSTLSTFYQLLSTFFLYQLFILFINVLSTFYQLYQLFINFLSTFYQLYQLFINLLSTLSTFYQLFTNL